MFGWRVTVALLVILLLLGMLMARAFKLQVTEHENYQTLSEKNRIRVLPIAPNRGLIYDRNGKLLAENRSVFSLELVPEQVDDMAQTLAGLQQLLDLRDDEVEAFKRSRRGKRAFDSIPLRHKLSEREVARFEVNRHRFPGASIQARLVRHYPYGADLVHALGYVGRINEREVKEVDPQNYRATQYIGKVGLEKFYEDQLHGKVGSQEVETDVHGRVLRVLSRTDPEPGTDLTLNLDIDLQLAAVRALDGQRGVVAAVDPQTGGVLALVSNPGYDPNEFVTGISPSDYKQLLDSPDRPLFNRALRGQYAPGSTIKPHLAWLGLKEGTITRETAIRDPGWFSLPNNSHRYRDWRAWGHGNHVNVLDAITESCDTYFYQLAHRLGIDKMHEGMTRFGFGKLTGIDIGEEVPALMPSREWKRSKLNQVWYPGETIIVGIGQGYWTATPLQLANAAAVIANDGIRYQLQMVHTLDNAIETETRVPVMAYDQIEPESGVWLDHVKQGMHDVVQGTKGTARAAFADLAYQAAGKSGTAQLKSIAQDEEYDEENIAERLRDNALFISFAPMEAPTIAVSVVVENAGGGSSNAAPVARQVMDHYLVGGDDNYVVAREE